jgi:tetratricopeptide (TPR) repeat protein
MTGTSHARLEEELRHLLVSLADLDDERAAGALSSERYRELHDRYTARAADIARALGRAAREREATPPEKRGRDRPRRRSRAPRRPRSTRRRLLAVLAVLALGGLGATGAVVVLGSPADDAGGAAASLAALRSAVRQHPGDASAHDTLAAALLRTGDPTGALKEFDAAASADPRDVVALAYGGWIALLAGSTDESLRRLDRAEAADPGYPDAHAFRGIALLRSGGDRAAAAAELRRYLQLDPGGVMDQQVRDVLAQLSSPPPPSPSPGP